MNIIPITFDENIPAYNIIGGKKSTDNSGENIFSVFILNRSGSIISDVIFENILSLKFKSIFTILNNVQNARVDALTEKFPTIKFIRTLEKVSPGEMINICASECTSKFFIVLWTDTIISSQGFIATMVDQLLEENKICTVPTLLNSKAESIPNQIIPSLKDNKNFVTEILATKKNKTVTLYPLDYIAIYNRKMFIELTGFDHTIQNPHWQLLDFSLRSFLWGHTMSIATSFRIKYLTELPIYDVTIDGSYRKFFLKNIAPAVHKVKTETEAYIPNKLFFAYFQTSGENIFLSWKKFRIAKKWIIIVGKRFKKSVIDLLSQWEPSL